MKKQITKINSSSAQRLGEHKMYQPLPDVGIDQLSPFLLLHHHGPHEFAPYNQGLPFGPHPHRGFETLTFIYSGEIEHADSQGFSSVIKDGGVQWMTAGRGIVHSENLSSKQRAEGGKMEIIQLWMNLPAKFKMIEPNYQGFQKEQISSVISEDGKSKIAVISGEYLGVKGNAESITGLQIYNIVSEKEGHLQFKVDSSRNILFYVLDGEMTVNDKFVIGKQLLVFDQEAGTIEVNIKENSRFIFATGEIIDEPMVAQGPFVMNSTTEILQAMRDYQMGKMGMM
jgi:redox-sensitive bicupin YhaK (pirin superfamily)